MTTTPNQNSAGETLPVPFAVEIDAIFGPESNPEEEPKNVLLKRLISTVASSQDGNPKAAIAGIIENGDATGMSVTDNLNALLADVIVRANKSVEIEEAISDLEYAAHELYEAARFLKDEFIVG